MKRIASLDFGSNTTLLLIAEVREGKVAKILCDETRVTKMGQGVHQNRRFHPDALERIRKALADYKDLIDQFGVDEVRAVATSAARDVENSSELFDMASNFGIKINVISGNDEADLTYRGAFSDKAEREQSCVIDVGGGSTELIYKTKDGIKGQSIDVGSVRLMDLFGKTDPLSDEDFLAMRTYVRERLNPEWKAQGFLSAIAVAGTPTIIASMEMRLEKFDGNQIDGFVLKKSVLKSWMEKLQKMSFSEREKIVGLPPERADVIVAGCVILFEFLDYIELEELEVSVRGVRFGLALC